MRLRACVVCGAPSPGPPAIARACTAAGVPAFSPHDLRHRRISLLLREEDPVTVSRLVGHARASMSLDVYGHVLIDEAEIDYERMLTR